MITLAPHSKMEGVKTHMTNTNLSSKPIEKKDSEKENSLKGTFISVMFLGGFLIVTWFGVWILYLSR